MQAKQGDDYWIVRDSLFDLIDLGSGQFNELINKGMIQNLILHLNIVAPSDISSVLSLFAGITAIYDELEVFDNNILLHFLVGCLHQGISEDDLDNLCAILSNIIQSLNLNNFLLNFLERIIGLFLSEPARIVPDGVMLFANLLENQDMCLICLASKALDLCSISIKGSNEIAINSMSLLSRLVHFYDKNNIIFKFDHWDIVFSYLEAEDEQIVMEVLKCMNAFSLNHYSDTNRILTRTDVLQKVTEAWKRMKSHSTEFTRFFTNLIRLGKSDAENLFEDGFIEYVIENRVFETIEERKVFIDFLSAVVKKIPSHGATLLIEKDDLLQDCIEMFELEDKEFSINVYIALHEAMKYLIKESGEKLEYFISVLDANQLNYEVLMLDFIDFGTDGDNMISEFLGVSD